MGRGACLADPPAKAGVFKAKEVMRSPPRGIFWGMTDEQRDRKLEALYVVEDEYVGFNVYVIIHLKPLRRIAAEYGIPKMEHPYHYAIADIIFKTAMSQAAQGSHEKRDRVFDERLKDQGPFLDIWDAITDDAPDHIQHLIGSTPIFRKDDDLRPLQAADLEAWWVRLRGTEKVKGLPRREYPWIPSVMPIGETILDEAGLRHRFEEMKKLREHLAIIDPSGEYF